MPIDGPPSPEEKLQHVIQTLRAERRIIATEVHPLSSTIFEFAVGDTVVVERSNPKRLEPNWTVIGFVEYEEHGVKKIFAVCLSADQRSFKAFEPAELNDIQNRFEAAQTAVPDQRTSVQTAVQVNIPQEPESPEE